MSKFLSGLAKGLATTARTMTKPAVTQQYPREKPQLPERSRGVIALLEENCTSCMLCARECPDWCIYIDSHKETIEPGRQGGRARQHNVLDRFAIDFSLCMYCGICIEVCPFDALFWSPDFEHSTTDIRELLHEKDTLGEWMTSVPDSALPAGYERPQVTPPLAPPQSATPDAPSSPDDNSGNNNSGNNNSGSDSENNHGDQQDDDVSSPESEAP